MIPLKYATASQEIPLGPFVDDSDGITAETGLTIANTDIQLWKAGATTLANKNSGGATHISNGIYYAVLDATDTNTYGPLTIFVQESGALAVKVDCWVMEADAYDALFAASGTGHLDADLSGLNDPTAADVADAVWDEAIAGHTAGGSFGEEVQAHAQTGDAMTLEAGSISDTTFNPGAIDATVIESNAIGSNELASTAIDEIAAGVRAEIDSNSTQLTAIVADTNELQGDWANGGRLDLLVDAILADTNELQSDDVPTLIAALPTAAEVRAEMDSNSTQLAAIVDDTGTAGVVISTATAQAIADEILKRGVDNVEDSADAHSLTAIVLAALESSLSGTTWTIKKTDGSTTFTTKTVTTNAAADPITAVT